MAETLRGGLSLAASGFGYWSHDIGGFEGTPDAGVFKRWLAFGLLSSHSRLHGSGSYRVPWAFDDEAVEVARRFVRLKMSLMPYLTRVAAEVSEGVPMLRPMALEFPDDPATAHLDTQYLLGDALLVAPVFGAAGTVSYYVPAGTWTHLLDGRTISGPRWVTETHGFDSLPVLVRPGTVLPIGARDDGPEYDYADGVALHLFAPRELADHTLRIPALGGGIGASFDVARDGDSITVTRTDGGAGRWFVVLPAGVQVATVAGAERVDEAGDTIGTGSRLRAEAQTVTITLAFPSAFPSVLPSPSQEDSHP
jgi:alpha-D-xyloside xylohydrolase